MADKLLYISFSKNWKKISKDFDRRIKPLLKERDVTLQSLIESCMPAETDSDYYFSSPSFERIPVEDKQETLRGRSVSWIKNVNIRPEHNIYSRVFLPAGKSLLVNGNIRFNLQPDNTVTFIFIATNLKLVDNNENIYGEICTHANGTKIYFPTKNKTYENDGLQEQSAIDMDLLNKIIAEVPMPNYEEGREFLKEWEEYIKFRDEYVKSMEDECYDAKIEIRECYPTTFRQWENTNERQELFFAPRSNAKGNDHLYTLEPNGSSNEEPVTLAKVTLQFPTSEYSDDLRKRINRLTRGSACLRKKGYNPDVSEDRDMKIVISGVSGARLVPLVVKRPNSFIKEIDDRINQEEANRKANIDRRFEKSIESEVEKEFQMELNAILDNARADLEKIDDPQIRENFRNYIVRQANEEFDKKRPQKYAEVSAHFARMIQDEYDKMAKDIAKLRDKAEQEKKKYIDSQDVTIEAYFQLTGGQKAEDLNKQIETIGDDIELAYDGAPEKAKIRRLRDGLYNLLNGNVRSERTPQFLLASHQLMPAKQKTDISQITWMNPYLDDSQKNAIVKALDADDLFLIQGPPGTGKTQVIAELTAQLCLRGCNVLISSETHKAIENAMQRLPHTPAIRPLRLLNDARIKSDFSHDNIVSNFYASIVEQLQIRVNRFEVAERLPVNMRERIDALRMKTRELTQLQNEANNRIARKTEVERIHNQLENQRSKFIAEKNLLTDKSNSLSQELYDLKRWKLNGDSDRMRELRKLFEINHSPAANILKPIDVNNAEQIKALMSLDMNIVEDEVARLSSAENVNQTFIRIEELKKYLTDNSNKGNDEYEQNRKEYLNLINNAPKANAKHVVMDFIHASVVNNAEQLKSVPKLLHDIRQSVTDKVEAALQAINGEKALIEIQYSEVENRLNEHEKQLTETSNVLTSLAKDDITKRTTELDGLLKLEVAKFFEDFHLQSNYEQGDYNTALDIMERESNHAREEFNRHKNEYELNKKRLRELKRYIENPSLAKLDETDIKQQMLADYINVYGSTCSGRTFFKISDNSSINLKDEDIDVVIIDEVSKSSFIDLLPPMLLGKKVVLVGDHRQLPPMYDLKYLTDEDFENLPIDEDQNVKFTEMIEQRYFFKQLFENIDPSYKAMLTRHYRSHPDILHLVNTFYNDKLQIGSNDIANKREHGIHIVNRGKEIISPDKHVYFIDSSRCFESKDENSDSKVNPLEIDLVTALLEKIDNVTDPAMNLSVGVICSYRAQAFQIKSKKFKSSNLNKNRDDRFVVSTVDDFQGDERDVIILSLVRNPRNPEYSDPTFITQYQRVNVAMSRARKLLIVIGAANYLEKYGLIDLPDMENSSIVKKNYPVYKEIISRINERGRFLDAVDVLEKDNEYLNTNKRGRR